jgi:hypothetical protein
MSSFLFYDPDNHHGPFNVDLDIAHIQHIDVLHDSITDNNNLQQVVCICSDNKSAIIEQIHNIPHIVSIYLCKESNHGKPETNPVYSPKVKDDLPLTPNSGWEFKGRLALLEACMKREYNAHEQGLNELQRLKQIEQQSLFTPQQSTETTEH